MTLIKEIQTRFLLPFLFARRSLSDCASKLDGARFNEVPVWRGLTADSLEHEHYQNESRPTTLHSLFGTNDTAARYFQLTEAATTALFPRRLTLVSPQSGESPAPLSIITPLRCELFFTPFGVGVLSLAWKLDERRCESPLSPENLLQFNYRFSQLNPWSQPTFQLDDPRLDPDRWNRIPEEQRQRLAPAPSADAPLADRLTLPGGRFTASELIGLLLAPLESSEFELLQSQLGVYTVARLAAPVTLLNEADRTTWGRLLAGLAQVEEPRHAGGLPDETGVTNALLNSHHWAAVGCLGAAHLVVDQAGDVPFNEERLPRSRDKYFMAFLSAYLQRLTIQRASQKIGRTVSLLGPELVEERHASYQEILQDLSEFSAADFLPDVSTREAVNRYYRLVQSGLRVHESWALVSQSVSGLDSLVRTERQEELAHRTAKTLESIQEMTQTSAQLLRQSNEVQHSIHKLGESAQGTLIASKELQAKVEWVEVFLIAVYVAELVHVVGESFGFPHWYAGVTIVGCSLGAMWLAYRILDPSHHHKLDRFTSTHKRIVAAILSVLLLVGITLAHKADLVAWYKKLRYGPDAPGATPNPPTQAGETHDPYAHH